jgi:hypothetical protein
LILENIEEKESIIKSLPKKRLSALEPPEPKRAKEEEPPVDKEIAGLFEEDDVVPKKDETRAERRAKKQTSLPRPPAEESPRVSTASSEQTRPVAKKPKSLPPAPPPPKPVLPSLPPVQKRKAKKKSWIGVSGYQSIDNTSSLNLSEVDRQTDDASTTTSEAPPRSVTPFTPVLDSFYRKHCLPLHLIVIPPGDGSSKPPTRYYLDTQLGLFFGFTSGRVFLDSFPDLRTRVALGVEKEELELTRVSEVIYSSMIFANEDTAKWIKWIPTRNGEGRGLKMTDVDVHLVKEEDIRHKVEEQMEILKREWTATRDTPVEEQLSLWTEELQLSIPRNTTPSDVFPSPAGLESSGKFPVLSSSELVPSLSPATPVLSELPAEPMHYVHKLKRFKGTS